jgi:alkylated DNA repair dioxygenase AlkB
MPFEQTLFEDAILGAKLSYRPAFLSPADADALLAWMLTQAPWQREAPILFGRPREARRRTCAFGEVGLRYRYSGVERVAEAWPALLRPIVVRLRAELACPFDFALANLYPDGVAAIGKHADDERGIAPGSTIAGLSLGATRDFVLYRRGGARVAEVALEHGSLVVMAGAMQRHFQHAVPPRRRVQAPRVNLTFRHLLR